MTIKLPNVWTYAKANPAVAGAALAGTALVGFMVVWLIWWALVGKPAQDRQNAAQARSTAIVATGQAGAAKDAVAVVTDTSERAEQHQAVTRKNTNDIRKAPGAAADIAPAVDDAGRRALCLRVAYRDDPACEQLRGPDTGPVEKAGPRRAAAKR